MKKRILLTGSTGGAGKATLKALYQLTDQYEVTALAVNRKRNRKFTLPFSDKINIVFGDIRDDKTIEKISKNVDFVIHLAAIIPPLADEQPDLAYQVNIVGTKKLIDALEKHSPNAFFLYTSSISVYGDRVKEPFIKVSDEIKPSERDDYALTKIETENYLQKSKLDWSIFRLTAMMGEHKMSKLMFHMPLNSGVEIITPKNVAKALVNAIEKREELSKRIFNFGGGEKMRLTYKELLEGSFRAYGMGKLDFHKYAFAIQNFHCGYYEDSKDLDDILHFQTEDLESYFKDLHKEINPVQRGVTKPLSSIVKYFMQKLSEPLQAYKNKDEKELLHYFGTTKLD